MRALYSAGSSVPFARVLREHRAALLPLGILLAINVLVLLLWVLPLTSSAAANRTSAETAEQTQRTAENEFKQAEATREGKARATTELETFYEQVLPADPTAARRMLQTKLQLLAREHGLGYERGATQVEEIRGSSLERMLSTIQLNGDYEDIRAFIYDLETADDFIVIDNLVLAEGVESNAPLSFSLELSTYYRKPNVPNPARTGGN